MLLSNCTFDGEKLSSVYKNPSAGWQKGLVVLTGSPYGTIIGTFSGAMNA